MAHSLNLSGISAAESCVNGVSLFGFVEKLYVFFSLPLNIDGIFSRQYSVLWIQGKDHICQNGFVVPGGQVDLHDALKSLSQHYKTYSIVMFYSKVLMTPCRNVI